MIETPAGCAEAGALPACLCMQMLQSQLVIWLRLMVRLTGPTALMA